MFKAGPLGPCGASCMTKFARTLSALDIFDAFRNQVLGADVPLQYLVII